MVGRQSLLRPVRIADYRHPYDTATDSGHYRKFYVRRILRIFSIFYIAAVVLFVAGILAGVHGVPGHLSFLFYVGYPAALLWPSLVQLTPFMPITHLWSLSVEFWATCATSLVACFVISGLALVCWFAFEQLGHATLAYSFLPCRMDTLAMGVALAITARKVGIARIQG